MALSPNCEGRIYTVTSTTTTQIAPTITWKGKSGKEYKYRIYPIGTTFKDEPGNYMFLKKTAANTYVSLYAGQGNLDERVSNPKSHHKWACVSKKGASEICAHINNNGEKARKAEEADLISALNPPCNG